MKVKSASLDVYRRKPGAINGERVTLPGGVVVELREWGCPQFFEAMQESGDLSNIMELSQDKAALDRAMGYWVIAAIYDDTQKITDPEKIHKIVSDPLMWQFRQEVIAAASDEGRFLVKSDLIKNSQPSLPRKSAGGEGTQVTMSTGQT